MKDSLMRLSMRRGLSHVQKVGGDKASHVNVEEQLIKEIRAVLDYLLEVHGVPPGPKEEGITRLIYTPRCLTSILKREYRKWYLTKSTANNTMWWKRHQSEKAHCGDNLDTVPPLLLLSPFLMARTTSLLILTKLPRSCL